MEPNIQIEKRVVHPSRYGLNRVILKVLVNVDKQTLKDRLSFHNERYPIPLMISLRRTQLKNRLEFSSLFMIGLFVGHVSRT